MEKGITDTVVTAVKEDQSGYWHVFAQTPFYAEGGGQPADRGWVDQHEVKDVQMVEGTTWHLLNQSLEVGSTIKAQIDEAVRQDHSIQHTAQHVMTAILQDRHGIETLSFGIHAEDASIEIGAGQFDWDQVEQLEKELQQIIFENRPVRMMELSEEKVDHSRLRKSTDRKGMVRIVEIEGIDYNACGGTHVETTAQLGIIHVTGIKKVRGNVRLSYVAGNRALRMIQESRTALRAIHQTLSTTNETVVERVSEERTIRIEREKEIKELELRIAKAKVEAVLQADDYVAIHIGKTEAETLTIAIVERVAATGKIAVGVNYGTKKLFVVHDGTHNLATGKCLKAVLHDLGFGRGGGSNKQAQARFDSLIELEKAMEEIVRRLQEGVLPC